MTQAEKQTSPKMTEQALAALSFEEALTQLEAIVRGLESGQQPLEESITLYEQGVRLRAHCQKKLDEAKMKVEKLTTNQSGVLEATPVDGAS